MNVSEAPDEIKILPLGTVHSQKGDFIVDDESFDLISRHFESRGLDLVIDYEHQTLKDIQAPAGGWIKKIVKTKDAIAAQVEWTAKAKQYLESGSYQNQEISELVGFSDPFYFSKRFKQCCGITPSEYRQKNVRI